MHNFSHTFGKIPSSFVKNLTVSSVNQFMSEQQLVFKLFAPEKKIVFHAHICVFLLKRISKRRHEKSIAINQGIRGTQNICKKAERENQRVEKTG